ncbi:MAG: hypothetical protein HY246_12485 [Proteobacteria bacterium]|nr:hypothetical protein [Pseudomonadota bacterium]
MSATSGQANPQPSTAPAPAAGRGVVALGAHFEIYPDRPFADLATPSTPAFHAAGKHNPDLVCGALICGAELPPRLDAVEVFAKLGGIGMLRLLEVGAVDWPGAQGQRMAVIVEGPLGGRVAPSAATFPPFQKERLLRDFLTPVAATLAVLAQLKLTHRAIRPDNLYYVDAARTQLALGPCSATPAAFDQPAIFESIESAMADPEARGAGAPADDMFALGMTLLALFLGRIPGADLDPDALLSSRIERGSLGACVEMRVLPPEMVDCLRGLLSDSPEARWSVAELQSWIAGKRQPETRINRDRRAKVPFGFDGREFHTARELAHAFGRNWDKAVRIIGTDAVTRWAKEELGDPAMAERFAAAVAAPMSGGRAAPDSLIVARACMILDPSGPMRFRGLNLRFDGLGPALAMATTRAGGNQIIADFLRWNIAGQWLLAQGGPHSRLISPIVTCERLSQWIGNPAPGFGLERCLYELNPAMPCRSPLTAKHLMMEASQLLPALNAAMREVGGRKLPIDRHVAAFLVVRGSYDPATFALVLGKTEPDANGVLAVLRLLAKLQKEYRSQPVPALATWCVGFIRPAIERYRSLELRAQINRRAAEIGQRGDLAGLLAEVDNERALQSDALAFTAAQAEYVAAEQQIAGNTPAARRRTAQRVGRDIAAVLAACVALLVVSATFLSRTL